MTLHLTTNERIELSAALRLYDKWQTAALLEFKEAIGPEKAGKYMPPLWDCLNTVKSIKERLEDLEA